MVLIALIAVMVGIVGQTAGENICASLRASLRLTE